VLRRPVEPATQSSPSCAPEADCLAQTFGGLHISASADLCDCRSLVSVLTSPQSPLAQGSLDMLLVELLIGGVIERNASRRPAQVKP
jgi:hypothetical protein